MICFTCLQHSLSGSQKAMTLFACALTAKAHPGQGHHPAGMSTRRVLLCFARMQMRKGTVCHCSWG